MNKDTPLEAEIRKAGVKPTPRQPENGMKISTIIKLVFIGIALWGLVWVWQEWNRQADMIRRGQEVGRVCLPPGKPVVANGAGTRADFSIVTATKIAAR